MPWFEVTLSDGSTAILQAHNTTQLTAALQQVVLTKVEQKRRCKQCRKAVASVQHTLCQPCWEEALACVRDTCQDIPMGEQELQDLTLSLFVDG